eukprot:11192085-Karenia_brevis.AAC.1
MAMKTMALATESARSAALTVHASAGLCISLRKECTATRERDLLGEANRLLRAAEGMVRTAATLLASAAGAKKIGVPPACATSTPEALPRMSRAAKKRQKAKEKKMARDSSGVD